MRPTGCSLTLVIRILRRQQHPIHSPHAQPETLPPQEPISLNLPIVQHPYGKAKFPTCSGSTKTILPAQTTTAKFYSNGGARGAVRHGHTRASRSHKSVALTPPSPLRAPRECGEHSPGQRLKWGPSASTQLIFSQVMLEPNYPNPRVWRPLRVWRAGAIRASPHPQFTRPMGPLLIFSENHSYNVNPITGYLYKIHSPKPKHLLYLTIL